MIKVSYTKRKQQESYSSKMQGKLAGFNDHKTNCKQITRNQREKSKLYENPQQSESKDTELMILTISSA